MWSLFLNNQGLNSSFLKSQDSFLTNQNAWCYTTASDAETLTVGRIKRDMKGEILLSTKQHFSSFLSRLHVRNKTYHLFIIHTSSHSCCCYWLLLPFRPPGRCLHTFCFTVTLLRAKCNHTNTSTHMRHTTSLFFPVHGPQQEMKPLLSVPLRRSCDLRSQPIPYSAV